MKSAGRQSQQGGPEVGLGISGRRVVHEAKLLAMALLLGHSDHTDSQLTSKPSSCAHLSKQYQSLHPSDDQAFSNRRQS